MPSDDTRERSLARLKRGYVLGALSTDTFERRVECVMRSQSTGEIDQLTQALPGGPLARAARAIVQALSPGREARHLLWVADRTTLNVGRSPTCEIVLSDDSVSRRHAELRFQDGRWTVRDVSSSNGTWVNGRRLRGELEIRRGDVLTFGDVSARF